MSIVAGIDQSPTSRLVVAKALEQAAWRDTDLHIVHVFYQPMVYTEAAINWKEVAVSQREGIRRHRDRRWGGCGQRPAGSGNAR